MRCATTVVLLSEILEGIMIRCSVSLTPTITSGGGHTLDACTHITCILCSTSHRDDGSRTTHLVIHQVAGEFHKI